MKKVEEASHTHRGPAGICDQAQRWRSAIEILCHHAVNIPRPQLAIFLSTGRLQLPKHEAERLAKNKASKLHFAAIAPTGQIVEMTARNWRTIDIDALDPEGQLTEDELVDPDPRSPAEAVTQAKSRSGQVRSMLQR